MTSTPQYYAPHGGHPPQTQLLTDRAVVTEAYTVIPKGVLRDIVTSVLPEWTNTRAWFLNRPVVGGATTFAQLIVEVQPGGGSTRPEPQREVEGFLFVLDGSLAVQHEAQTPDRASGGIAFLPPGAARQVHGTGAAPPQFQWFRKRSEPLERHAPKAVLG